MKIFLLLCFSFLTVSAQEYPTHIFEFIGPQSCSNDTNSSSKGYIDLKTLNNDIVADALNGGNDSAEYVICPDTVFNFTSTIDGETKALIPTLSNMSFKCGESGERKNNCVFTGGDYQIVFNPELQTNRVEFHGFTMEMNTGASVGAWGTSGSSALFVDCAWKNNDGFVLVDIHVRESEKRSLSDSLSSLTPYNQIGTPIDFSLYDELVSKNKARDAKNHGRRAQKDDFAVAFSSCSFTNNFQVTGGILSVGAYVELANCNFERNNAGAILIGAASGSSLLVHSSSTFIDNINSFATIFVDQTSSLRIANGTVGVDNIGTVCHETFVESSSALCLQDGYNDTNCFGTCCDLGDTSCS